MWTHAVRPRSSAQVVLRHQKLIRRLAGGHLQVWIFDTRLRSQTVVFTSSQVSYIIRKEIEYTFQKSDNLEMVKLTENRPILTLNPP